MSLDSLLIIEGENIESAGSVAAYSYDNIFLNYAASKASLLTVQLRHSQTDLNAEHHNEKHALTALNERFHLFVEYVQRLEEQHAKYIAQLVSFIRHSYDISTIESKYKKEYVHLNSDLMALNNEKIDDEIGYEMFQLQAAIYCQLIELEQYTKDEQCLKLEQELNKTSSMLNTLRTSHAHLQQEIKTLFALRSETLQQNVNLEIEIILYRDLLGCTEKHKELVVSSSSSERSMARKWTIKGYTIGSVGIKDCSLDGDYITVINHSKTKNFDISKWVLIHQVDFEPVVEYKIPDGIQLQEDGEAIIYSTQGANVAKLSLTDHAISSLLHQKLVNRELFSWGKRVHDVALFIN
ncbi:unnamed protein product [Rotaria sp. Silwood1]|nr:unnamed protein product [Rotaria sp. Silwood1]